VGGLALDHHAQRHHRVAAFGQGLGDDREFYRAGHPGHDHVVHSGGLGGGLGPFDHVVDQVAVPA
jgi:hypothetical protein